MPDQALIKVIIDRINDMPGLGIILSVYSKRKYGKNYIELFLEDLKSAYDMLADVLKSNESTDIVFTYILKTITNDDEK